MATANEKNITKQRYPGCLAHAVSSVFYSVVANRRRPKLHTYKLFNSADDKNGYILLNNDKKGVSAFAGGKLFDVHVAVCINRPAQHDVCASSVHYSSYIPHRCLRTGQRPTACDTSTFLSEKPNVMVIVLGTYGKISSAHRQRALYLRRAS